MDGGVMDNVFKNGCPADNGLIRIGIVTKACGVRGEFNVTPLTDDPERFRLLSDIYAEMPVAGNAVSKTAKSPVAVKSPVAAKTARTANVVKAAKGEARTYYSVTTGRPVPAAGEGYAVRPERIEGVRFHRGQVVVKLAGCGDADAAEAYRGAYISITRDQLVPLNKDSFFVFDLIGCEVLDESGERLGILVEVLETGSNDVYVVKPVAENGAGGDLLIPALKSVVREVDVAKKRIVVNVPTHL